MSKRSDWEYLNKYVRFKKENCLNTQIKLEGGFYVNFNDASQFAFELYKLIEKYKDVRIEDNE